MSTREKLLRDIELIKGSINNWLAQKEVWPTAMGVKNEV